MRSQQETEQRTTQQSSALLRLSPVELGRILSFLPPCDLYVAATSVCRYLSSAATEAWELWPATAAVDEASLLHVSSGVSQRDVSSIRSLQEWQWYRVLITRDLLPRAGGTLTEEDATAFLRADTQSLAFAEHQRTKQALEAVTPLSAAGRSDALYGVVQHCIRQRLSSQRFTMLWYPLLAVVAVPTLGMMSEMCAVAAKSQLASQCFDAVLPLVELCCGALAMPNDSLQQWLDRFRVLLEALACVVKHTEPLCTPRGVSLIQKQLRLALITSTSASTDGETSSVDGVLEQWMTARGSLRFTLFDSPGASAILCASLMAGLLGGAVAAVYRRRWFPVSSRSRFHVASSEPRGGVVLSREWCAAAGRRWSSALSVLIHVTWLHFAFVAAAAIGDSTLVACLARLDAVPQTSNWLRCSAVLCAISNGSSIWRFAKRRRSEICAACLGVAVVALCHYDSSLLFHVGYWCMTAVPAPLDLPPFDDIVEMTPATSTTPPIPALDRSAIVAFVASRPIAIALRAVSVAVGYSLIDTMTLMSRVPKHASDRASRESSDSRARWLSSVVVGACAAYVASVESAAQLRGEVHLSNLLLGSLLFALAATVGDALGSCLTRAA